MNSSWARVRTRLRSSEGWKEKSKPASVLTTVSRAITSAVLMRRLSRTVSSSASRADGVQRRDFAAFELADRPIEDFQRAGHPQADQGAADPVEDGRDNFGRADHDRSPSPARRRPTAA